MNRKTVLLLISIIYLIFMVNYIVGEVPKPTALRAVQCIAAKTQEEANLCKVRIEQLGYSPVWQINEKDRFKILVGKCESYLDAHILRDSLRNNGFPDAFVRTFPEMAEESLAKGFIMPDEPIVLSQKTTNNNQVEEINLSDYVVAKSFISGIENKDKNLTIKEGSKLISQLNNDDLLKGYVINEMVKAMVAKDKKDGATSALPLVLKVAKGEISSSKKDLIKSRLIAADIIHYYNFKPVEAYKAYNEILEEHGSDPSIKAKTLVEIAACQLELARSKKSDFEEVRRACKKIIEFVPTEYKRARAVAELMYAETYMYAGEMDKALEAFKDFEVRHPDRIREISMAYILQGCIYGQIGEWEKCKMFYEKAFSMQIENPKEMFSWLGEPKNIKAKAAKWLVYFADLYKDNATSEKYKSYLDSGSLELKENLKTEDFSFHTDFYLESNN